MDRLTKETLNAADLIDGPCSMVDASIPRQSGSAKSVTSEGGSWLSALHRSCGSWKNLRRKWLSEPLDPAG